MTGEEAIKNIVAYMYYAEEIPDEVGKAFDIAIKVLEDMNTKLSVAYLKGRRQGQSEVRIQGEWIRTGSIRDGNAHYECSNCHYGDEYAESQEVPYCWHCGARMKGVEVKNANSN